MEKWEQYKSDDYISLVIINSIAKLLLMIPPVRSYFIKTVYAAGMYEYVIARTKFIDKELRGALQDGTEQVLIFGAGFDSGGIRFLDIAKNAMIFELDAPVTHSVKIERYKEKEIVEYSKLKIKIMKKIYHLI